MPVTASGFNNQRDAPIRFQRPPVSTIQRKSRLASISENKQVLAVSRVSSDKYFPTRKRVVLTNFASGGALRNIPKNGDGLASLLGRFLTRNILTEAVGATAGLIVFGGLYGLGLALAAVNVKKTAKRRIESNIVFKEFLRDHYKDKTLDKTKKTVIDSSLHVIDQTILNHERQKREAYGLWFSTAGSTIGPVGRILEAVGSSPLISLSALTGGLVGFGLATFGSVLVVNDAKKLVQLKKISFEVESKEGESIRQKTESENLFEDEYQKFYKNYKQLLKLSIINSSVLTLSSAVFPLASLMTLGAAAPVLGALAGTTGFLRFTLFEPRLEKNTFKPLSVSWAEIYDAEDGPSRATAFSKLKNINNSIAFEKKQLRVYLSLRDKAVLKLTKMMDIFPFLKGIHNKAYASLVAKAMENNQDVEKFMAQVGIELNLMAKVLSEIQGLQAIKKDSIEKRMNRLETQGTDPYGEISRDLKSLQRQSELEEFQFSLLKESVNRLSDSVVRYVEEGYIDSKAPMIKQQIGEIKKKFISILGAESKKAQDLKPLQVNREFLKTINRMKETVGALKVNLFHLRAAEDRALDKKFNDSKLR